MRPFLAVLASLVMVSCRNGDDRRPAGLEEVSARERAGDPVGATFTLIWICCPRNDDTSSDRYRGSPDAPAACRELTRVIETATHDRVLQNAIEHWGPGCYTAIPVGALLAALDNPLDRDTRSAVIHKLAEMAPSEDVVRRLVRELGHPDERVQDAAWVSLARFGEEELAPLVEALSNPDPVVRRNAAWAFGNAAEAPLDLPEAFAELERTRREDPVADVRGAAGRAFDALVEARARPMGGMVEVLARGWNIHLLARRRAFCGSAAVTAALEQLRGVKNRADEAERVIAERARRCDTSGPRSPRQDAAH